MKYVISLCFFLIVKSQALTYQYEVSMCCIFQNEDRFLKEWIDYHRMIGVEHFYMYDNRSTDQVQEVLAPYIKSGIVEYIVWDLDYNTATEWWNIQRNAYLNAIERSIGVSKWLCINDTDEFIVPILDRDLPMFLKDYESFGGVIINWVLYGTSGVEKIPKNKLMVNCLLKRAKLDHVVHRLVKSIVRPERIDLKNSSLPHTCAYIKPYFHVNSAKKRPIKGEPRDICIDRIRINHYWSRDREYLLNDKFQRYARWYGEEVAFKKIDAETKMNDVRDPIILNVMKRFQKK